MMSSIADFFNPRTENIKKKYEPLSKEQSKDQSKDPQELLLTLQSKTQSESQSKDQSKDPQELLQQKPSQSRQLKDFKQQKEKSKVQSKAQSKDPQELTHACQDIFIMDDAYVDPKQRLKQYFIQRLEQELVYPFMNDFKHPIISFTLLQVYNNKTFQYCWSTPKYISGILVEQPYGCDQVLFFSVLRDALECLKIWEKIMIKSECTYTDLIWHISFDQNIEEGFF